MGKTTKIEWTDASWNPWCGCLKVSPGCKLCYMYRDQKRYGTDPKEIRRTKDPTFNGPLKWKKPRKIFTCSWSDFFLEEADPWRREAWDIIKQTPYHTYQILTKRPENILGRLPDDWNYLGRDHYSHVWLGVSVENQDYVHRIESLATIDAPVRFVSYEPALGPIDLELYFRMNWCNWLIAGGESGPGWRKPEMDWFRDIRDQCVKHGVPFFYKQFGGTNRKDGTWGGRTLDGRTWDEMPKVKTYGQGTLFEEVK